MPIEFNVNPYNDDFNADNGPRSHFQRWFSGPWWAFDV